MYKAIKEAPSPGVAELAIKEAILGVARSALAVLEVEAKRSYHDPGRTVSDPSGALQSSIVGRGPTWIGPGALEVQVSSSLPYAAFVEMGTGLYGPFHSYITPKTAAFMKWTTYTARAAALAQRLGFPHGPGFGTFYLRRTRGQVGWHAFAKAIESPALAASLAPLEKLPVVVHQVLTAVR